MKALTICNPFPEMILEGEKHVENRSWRTRYRGPLVIHAGKSTKWMQPGDWATYGSSCSWGAIVGIVKLVACVHIDDIRAGEYTGTDWGNFLPEHEHTNGPWCWVLENPERFKPFPYPGRQGLWRVPDSILPVLWKGENSIRCGDCPNWNQKDEQYGQCDITDRYTSKDSQVCTIDEG